MQTSEETISEIIQRRSITEVVHFTSNDGLVHILKDGAVLSRTQLDPKFYAEAVMNAKVRWDKDWYDYISLSLTWINAEFFDICHDKWYADTDKFWVLLSFDPAILEHPGVYFSTTNNGYGNTLRKMGPEGLEGVFGPLVAQRKGQSVRRDQACPTNWPTCAQAEALYPRRLPLDHLLRVYVYDEELRDIVVAQACILRPDLEVVVDQARFEHRM